MESRSPADVLKLAKDEGAEFVDLRFCDLPGVMQHFSMPIQNFGVLSAVTLLTALVANLVLLPALLATTKIITLWDLLTVRLGREPTKTIPFLRGLRPAQARIVVLMGEVKEFSPGELIVRRGDPGEKRDHTHTLTETLETMRALRKRVERTQVHGGDDEQHAPRDHLDAHRSERRHNINGDAEEEHTEEALYGLHPRSGLGQQRAGGRAYDE